jgi:hypothetical protein
VTTSAKGWLIWMPSSPSERDSANRSGSRNKP